MSIVYKIACKNENVKDFYIGSTTNFKNRKKTHKYYCQKNFNIKLYNFINENDGWDNFEMSIIEEYPNIDRKELNKKEFKFIYDLNPQLNKHNPLRYNSKMEYKREWQRNNKEKTRQWAKNYYHNNKDKIKEKYKEKKSSNYINDTNQKEQSAQCANMCNDMRQTP